MKQKMTLLTKLTLAGLVSLTIAIWIQWFSGDPAYPKFPPGPVFFIATAGIIFWFRRWLWAPMIGALIALLVTAGWFLRIPQNLLRLTHPGEVGHFPAGIFLGSLMLIGGLLFTDIVGVAATVHNFRRAGRSADTAKMACRLFGAVFVLMGVLIIIGGGHADKYHNLMHLTWGALAVGISFLGTAASKRFCLASGVFYLALAALGFLLGNPSSNWAWHFGPMLLNKGDHIFHLLLGLAFLAFGVFSPAHLPERQGETAGELPVGN